MLFKHPMGAPSFLRRHEDIGLPELPDHEQAGISPIFPDAAGFAAATAAGGGDLRWPAMARDDAPCQLRNPEQLSRMFDLVKFT